MPHSKTTGLHYIHGMSPSMHELVYMCYLGQRNKQQSDEQANPEEQ